MGTAVGHFSAASLCTALQLSLLLLPSTVAAAPAAAKRLSPTRN